MQIARKSYICFSLQLNLSHDQADIFPMPSCNHIESTLLSDKHLPVKPPPMPSDSVGLVPKIVHYISLGCKRVFTFANYLSVLSVHKVVDPDRIYFHGDCTPLGAWWKQTLQAGRQAVCRYEV